MKVFISSVITGMEGHRAAARQAAETLGHTVTAAEDFRASPQSLQQVCLGAVRDADVVVLLLGARYGAPQASGISPTHEEYREARGTKPVLAFVQKGVTRPGDLDDASLRRDMQREAVYGNHPVFDPQHRVQKPVVQGTTLLIAQADAQITLDEQGSVRVSRPARDVGREPRAMGGLPTLIAEEVREHVADGIGYAGWLLNRVDPTNRLRRVALACRLAGIGYLPWRTRAEVAQSPNSASMGSGVEAADSPPVVLARAALLFDTTRLADDITVRLRRQVPVICGACNGSVR